MDKPTANLRKLIEEREINLMTLSHRTGIAYQVLFDSLRNNKRERSLRAGEYCMICAALGISADEYGGHASKS
ncbi:MAG: helix-turn-helix domain-containing protein [Lachnospiraceae bacterium]|nr:helix-turn-helix domain-containing protein [Lachnospiraceae bacterium]